MCESVTANGYSWRLGGELSAGELDPILSHFPGLDSLPGAEVLKENHFRSVFLVPADCLSQGASPDPSRVGVIAKAYRYITRWDRLRYRVIRSRAEQEWLALRRFHQLGLPTASPLAVAQLRKGGVLHGGGLIVSYLAGTETLSGRLDSLREKAEQDAPGPQPSCSPEISGEASRLLQQTGELLRRVHDLGVWHRDLHGGNFLVSVDEGKIYLVDLHTCFFLRRLARWQARRGVVKLLHSLQATVPQDWLQVLLNAYDTRRLYRGGTPLDTEKRLVRATTALERKRLRSRSKRCFRQSTRFRVHRERGFRYYRLADYTADELESLWHRTPPEDCLKQTGSGWVAVMETGAGRRVCVKYHSCSVAESLQSLVESHRLRRAYANGHALWVRHIPSPQVVALRERVFMGCVREAWLVTEFVSEAMPLDGFLKSEYWGHPVRPGAKAKGKHVLSRRVGAFLRTLHDAGLYPHDLSPQNLLVERRALEESHSGAALGDLPLDGLHLVDLDHLYLWQPLWRRGRRKNLVQMGNLCEGHITTLDRLRALRAYAFRRPRLAHGGTPRARPQKNGKSDFWSRSWVQSLRSGILKEHAKVLDSMLRREKQRGVGERRAP